MAERDKHDYPGPAASLTYDRKLVQFDLEYAPLKASTPLSGLHEWFFTPDPNAETLVLLVWRYRFNPDGSF